MTNSRWCSNGQGGRADDRVTLSADLETMDLFTTSTPPPTLSAAEPRRLRNDFEDFFGTRRPQLIRSAEIALHLLTSWDLLVVDKPAGARPRSATRLESDAELLSAEDADVPLRWRRLLESYDHRRLRSLV